MQEEYGIKLKILTDGLKNSIMQVKGMIHNFKNDIKQDTEVNFTIDNNLTLKQLQKFKSDIENELAKIKESSKVGARMNVVDPDEERKIKNLTAGLTMIKERIAEIGNESEDTKQKISGISVSANMTNNTIVNGFKNSWKSIKRFAFSLLSLRGIYGLVRKASSAYMAQDKGLAEQMQKTWASVGAMLAPIIETIVKWIRIGAAYLNYFIKALTGKDLIGKAVKKINKYNKSLGGTAKAAKSVNKELTTMDEVTNLSFDDASTQGIEDAAEAFDDFGDIKLDKNVTDVLDTIAEKLKKVGEFLKPVIDWAKEHPGAVLAILGGAKLLGFLGKLVGPTGLLGAGAGGLLGILTAIAAIGTIAISISIVWNEQRKFATEVQEAANSASNLTKSVMDTEIEVMNYAKSSASTTDDVKSLNDNLLGMNRTFSELDAIRGQYTWLSKLDGSYQDIDRQIEGVTNRERMDTLTLYNNWKQKKMTVEQNKQFKKRLQDNIKQYEKLAKSTKKGTIENEIYNERLTELKTMLDTVNKTESKPKVDLNTNDFDKKKKTVNDVLSEVNNFFAKPKIGVDDKEATDKFNGIKSMFNDFKNTVYKTKIDIDAQKEKEVKDKAKEIADNIKSKLGITVNPKIDMKVGTKDARQKIINFLTPVNNAFSKLGVGSVTKTLLNNLLNAIPAYDVGTPYVPNDQLAMVHKGEAIIPKKFNNEQFFNSNNEETNALLIEVNQNLIELRNRPNVLEVNGKELAQATYNDFQNEGNRLNQSMTIKKVGGN